MHLLQIITEEAEQFREAFVAAADGHVERVRLTIIVLQAHSNYRIYPEHIQQGSASQQNVPPGTVVDLDVVHPTQTEFILVAHKSIMVRWFCSILQIMAKSSCDVLRLLCDLHFYSLYNRYYISLLSPLLSNKYVEVRLVLLGDLEISLTCCHEG